MKSKKKLAKKVGLDVDAAIEHYNKDKPVEKHINKIILAEMLDTSVQNLYNYSIGKTPKIMALVFNAHLITGYPTDKLIKNIK